jgi:FkbM family methyltransferase
MPLALNRVINVEDFVEPHVRGAIREVFAHELPRHPDFPAGLEHRALWEAAMSVLAFRESGVLRADAEILGIGTGAEPALFWLTNHVRRVWANPAAVDWPGPWNRRRLVAQSVDARDIAAEGETFDGIILTGPLGQFGGMDNLERVLGECYRVLKPGGVLSLCSDFSLQTDSDDDSDGPVVLTSESIPNILLADHDWEPVTPPDFSVSRATYETEVAIDDLVGEQSSHAGSNGRVDTRTVDPRRYPYAVVRSGSTVFTSVHLALGKAAAPAAQAPAPAPTPRLAIRASEPRADIAALARHLPDPLVVLDGGCRWGFGEHWTALHSNVRMIGFDPDEAECQRLAQLYGDRLDATLVPIALGSAPDRLRLRRFKFTAASSFHAHDEERIRHVAIPREGDVLDEFVEVEVDTVDRWCAEHDVARLDAMKLDVQGHELEILRGALERLADVRAIELEVCLNPLMMGTPLFGEIDAFLRERGFYLWRLRDLAHYQVKETEGAAGSIERAEHLVNHGDEFTQETITWTAPPGFLSWANAHYVRTELFEAEAALPWTVRLRDAVLMNALHFHDLAVLALRRTLEQSPPAVVADDVRDALDAATEIPPAPSPQTHVAADLPVAGDAVPVAAEEAPIARSGTAATLRRRVKAFVKRPYWPLVWRLERNHQHAQWRADAHDHRLGELGARLDQIESAVLDRLSEPPSSPLEGEVRHLVHELRQMHQLTNEAVIEWTALMGRVLEESSERQLDDVRA